jgi:uncharacterized membrane protein
MRFIVFHVVWFSIWLWLNSGSKGRLAFDPFPYQLLSTVVSLESIFLSLFILMSQNRSNVQADQRNHLDLQINLLSEEENTKMLQMLQAIKWERIYRVRPLRHRRCAGRTVKCHPAGKKR